MALKSQRITRIPTRFSGAAVAGVAMFAPSGSNPAEPRTGAGEMIKLSSHARRRCSQRGINNRRLAALMKHADVERPAGSGCWLLRVSRREASRVRGFDNLHRFSVLVGKDGDVVTVLPVATTRRGRRYRRGR